MQATGLAAVTACNVLQQPLETLIAPLPEDWRPWVLNWAQGADGRALMAHLDQRLRDGAVIHPGDVFRALTLCPLQAVRVVILGQDPYHGPGQAHGLAFSVPDSVRPPPSLKNIFIELHRELGSMRRSPDLSSWARQGVLLLNTSLTVETGKASSHAAKGWEALTAALVTALAERGRACAYLLWGAHAQRFEATVLAHALEGPRPLILKANHPSPLSARRPPVPFLGCGHFSAVNAYLRHEGLPEIDWLE